MTTIFLAGSGSFGLHVAQELTAIGHDIVGVTSPTHGRHDKMDLLAAWADRTGTPWGDVGVLTPERIPEGTQAILAAHSHAFIGARTRARAQYALGYHPSLLPLHRGRDAVKWQARMHERVVGGSIYHLSNRIDGGPIAYQRHVVVEDGLTASQLWSAHLFEMGIDMLCEAAYDIDRGAYIQRRPQDDKLATWEPALDGKPLHRTELLEIEA